MEISLTVQVIAKVPTFPPPPEILEGDLIGADAGIFTTAGIHL